MNSTATLRSSRQAPLASMLSLIVPGAGQFYLGKREIGMSILLATLTQGYLIYWALDNFRIGQVTAGGVETSWLLYFLGAFWAWNVFDANRRAQGARGADFVGLLIPAIVIYLIAWEVTDVRLDRLVDTLWERVKDME